MPLSVMVSQRGRDVKLLRTWGGMKGIDGFLCDLLLRAKMKHGDLLLRNEGLRLAPLFRRLVLFLGYIPLKSTGGEFEELVELVWETL